MYLTYVEYRTLGGNLSEDVFNEYEFRAESIINYRTFNRLKNESEMPYEVTRLMFHIINMVEASTNSLNIDISDNTNSVSYIKSESNDGVSISYNIMNASELYATCNNDIQESIDIYLSGVKNSKGQYLLYRGVYPGE